MSDDKSSAPLRSSADVFEVDEDSFYRSSKLACQSDRGHRPRAKDVGNGLTPGLRHAVTRADPARPIWAGEQSEDKVSAPSIPRGTFPWLRRWKPPVR